MKVLPPKRWAVVQELLPFCIRVDKRYRVEAFARRRASYSRYLTVMRADEADRVNERLKNDREYFDRELDRQALIRGLGRYARGASR